jgi:hypothetical protein
VSSKIRFATWHFLLISHPVGIASGPSPGRVPRAEGQPGRVARCQILYGRRKWQAAGLILIYCFRSSKVLASVALLPSALIVSQTAAC